MHRITISVLAVLALCPVTSYARMPVVDIASGSVSARSAFGADGENKSVATAAAVSVAPTRKVVSRRAKTRVSAPISADSGANIVASNDVLVPRRPSADLWARNDVALRMPSAGEFSVIRSDDLLPEESLDKKIAVAKPVSETESLKTEVNNLDNQIAQLIDLQKRATDSVRTVPAVASVAQKEVANDVRIADADQTVSLRQMVVPMNDVSADKDVVIRRVDNAKASPKIASVRNDMTKLSPAQLRQAFRKTFLSENKHLSTYSIDDAFDVSSDMSASIEGFTAKQDLSEGTGIRPLEIKIGFRDEDSALSRANYTLLTEYAGIVVNKPTRAIQIAIPEFMTTSSDARKLAARRLAIVEQVLTDNGVSKQRIVPVLSKRNETGFVLRIISNEQYETLTQQKRDIFGDSVGKKTYKSMSW
ncbi:MAG: hypothetical protein UIH99_02830 [Alphaproteobacteria bacterium]|nr:hypothetical protein [Alphaproteobacteria bacterium]